jgi:AMIN domain
MEENLKQRDLLFRGPILLIALILGLAGAAVAQATTEQVIVEGVTTTVVDTHLEVLIKVRGAYTFETFDLVAPKRLVVDIKPSERNDSEPVITVNSHGVLRIRCGQFQSQVSRVVFDLMDEKPSSRISSDAEGIKVSFWVETPGAQAVFKEVEQETRAERPPVTAPRPQAAQPAPVRAAAAPAMVSGERGTYVQLRGGASLFPSPDSSVDRTFDVYGETGSFTETYRSKLSYLFDLAVSRDFPLGTKMMRGGLGANLLLHQEAMLLDLTVPSPVAENSPRTVAYEEPVSNTVLNFYAFAQFPLVRKTKFNLWAGPTLGFATGKFTLIEDFEIEDKAPFSSADVKVSSTTPLKESISGLTFGARVSLEYLLTPKMSIILDGNFFYFGPSSESLEINLKYMQAQLLLGLQIRI